MSKLFSYIRQEKGKRMKQKKEISKKQNNDKLSEKKEK
jgi:hypothetical protein